MDKRFTHLERPGLVGWAILLVGLFHLGFEIGEEVHDSGSWEHFTQWTLIVHSFIWMAVGVLILTKHTLSKAMGVFSRIVIPALFSVNTMVCIGITVMLIYGTGLYEDGVKSYGKGVAQSYNFFVHSIPLLETSFFIFLLIDVICYHSLVPLYPISTTLSAVVAIAFLMTYIALFDPSEVYETSFPVDSGIFIMGSAGAVASALLFLLIREHTNAHKKRFGLSK